MTEEKPERKHSILDGDVLETDVDLFAEIKKKKVEVHSEVFISIAKNYNKQKQNDQFGLIYGVEHDDSIECTLTIPYDYSQSNNKDIQNNFIPIYEEIKTMSNYLELARLDQMPLGIYISSEKNEISKKIINLLKEFQGILPHCILLNYNPASIIDKFTCYRLNTKLIHLNLESQIDNIELDLFSKKYTSKFLEELKINVISDVYSKLSLLTDSGIDRDMQYSSQAKEDNIDRNQVTYKQL